MEALIWMTSYKRHPVPKRAVGLASRSFILSDLAGSKAPNSLRNGFWKVTEVITKKMFVKGNLEKAPAPPLQQKLKLFLLGSSQETWFTRTSESQSEPRYCQAHNNDSEGPGGHQMRSRAETQEKVCSARVHLYVFFNSHESLDSQENRCLSSVSMGGAAPHAGPEARIWSSWVKGQLHPLNQGCRDETSTGVQ